MPATYEDIEIEAGATWEREWSVVDENGAVADLTGFTGELEMRRGAGDSTVLLSLTTSTSGLTIVALTGLVIARIEAAATKALTWQRAVYDLLITNGSNTWRIGEGAVTVSPDVTEL